jgi:hypothetical protein
LKEGIQMSTHTPFRFAALAVALLLATGAARAQLARTFVSADGNDANPCSRVFPCRSFAVAHAKTIAGGEINMLDPAGYGSVTITKAISIVNDGVGSAGVLVLSGQNGVTISAGPNDAVNLRGLIIEGTQVGTQGIVFNTGKSLTIENCVVRNLVSGGILFYPSASSRLVVSNTFIADVGFRGIHNVTGIGVYAQGTGSSGTIDMAVTDSVTSGNSQDGISANSLGGAITKLTVMRSLSIGNDAGLTAINPNGHVRVAQTTITGNANGWSTAGGATLESYGDNDVNGNAANEGVMPLAMKK